MQQKNMLYAGIDLHRKYAQVTLLDEKGYVQQSTRVENKDTQRLVNVLSQPNKLTLAGVECTYGWYWLADLIESIPNVKMKLGHASGIKKFAKSRKKTDKIDSKLMADLMRINLFPESHQTSKQHRVLKDVLRHRAYLVQQRSSLKCRLHAMLAKQNIECKFSDILGKKARLWLVETVNQYPYDLEVRTSLELADNLDKQISSMDEELDGIADKHPDIELITSIPGVGKITGLTILAEIDDVSRFPNPRKLCSYAGLVPSVSSSGGKTHYGPTGGGNKYIRTMLAESVYHTIKKVPELNKKYEHIKETKGTNKARVTAMRKLLTYIYCH